jgi:putative Mg2+ transporter-C (MgtC) family protein
MGDAGLPLFESLAQLQIVLLPFVVRCGAAAFCGGLVGLERELKGKPAGLRTNILICVGAAIYMQVGLLLVHAGGETRLDITRIAAQIVTGIGFLGAGCIIQQGSQITGLTSAATIWVVAAIGIVAGAGFPVIAFIAAIMVVLTLYALGKLEKHLVVPMHPDDRYHGREPKSDRP